MSKFPPVLFAVFLLAPSALLAAETPWMSADNLRARLISGKNVNGVLEAALDVELAQGWHSYWKSPGDAGLAPVFDWSASENVEKAEVSWPWPLRFDEMGITTFGYEGAFAFPLTIHIKDPAKDARLDLALSMMICKDICIPENIKLSLAVPASGAQGGLQSLIDMKKRAVPSESAPSTLAIDAVVAGPKALSVSVFSKGGFEGADLFAFAGDRAFTARPVITLDEKRKGAGLITVSTPSDIRDLSSFLAGKELVIVFVSAGRAVEKAIKF